MDDPINLQFNRKLLEIMDTIRIFRKLAKDAHVEFTYESTTSDINMIELECKTVESVYIEAENDKFLIDECYMYAGESTADGYIFDKETNEVIDFTEKEMKVVTAYLEKLLIEKYEEFSREYEQDKSEILDL